MRNNQDTAYLSSSLLNLRQNEVNICQYLPKSLVREVILLDTPLLPDSFFLLYENNRKKSINLQEILVYSLPSYRTMQHFEEAPMISVDTISFNLPKELVISCVVNNVIVDTKINTKHTVLCWAHKVSPISDEILSYER